MEQIEEETKHLQRSVAILVSGIGVSSIGDFIYLVALNIFVLNKTHSATAVAALWIVGKVAALLVSPWAGSVTDRLSLRKQLIGYEVARAVIISLLPLMSGVWMIYLLLFLLGTFSTFFGNAFLPFQTLLIPQDQRKRVSSVISTLRSSAIIIGPAIAGLLLSNGDTPVAFWLDGVSFLVSGLSFFLLPNLVKSQGTTTKRKNMWHYVRADFHDATSFLRDNVLYTTIFAINSIIAIFAATADAQEVVFAQEALHLGQFGYSMMMVAAGVGFIAGSLLLSILAKRVRTEWMIGLGTLISSLGYLTYALAHSFWSAVTGLVVLGIFGSARSVGITTYMQHAVPVSLMGRINNVVGPPQQVLMIMLTFCGGLLASSLGVRDLMVGMTVLMTAMSLYGAVLVFLPHNRMHVRAADEVSVEG